MSLITVEVDLDHGRVTPRGVEQLPERGEALLILLPSKQPHGDPLIPDPELQCVVFHESPALPLTEDEWPEIPA